jgi:hypothetical protein
MSTAAIAVGVLVHGAVLVPLALACRAGRVGDAALALCPLLALAAVVWQSGLFDGSRAEVTLGIREEAGPSEEACKQVRARLEEVGLLLDDSDPQRVVVASETWRQLPDSVRAGVTDCFARLAPGGAPVEIVERPAT